MLFRRGLAAEDDIAVRKASEPANDPGMVFRPFQVFGMPGLPRQLDAADLVGQLLRMHERQIEEFAQLRIDPQLREFLYLPFMHSEELADQIRCIELSRQAGHAENLKWAEHHAGIIRRFGRFPHRNVILGRETTPEEQAFLDDGGFAP